MLVAFDATEDLRRSRTSPWVQRYKWPIYFFVAVAFWNMVGAGLFGFMINPPIALYYMQGLNTTPLHGHAALFGVYGMLGIGLMLRLSARLDSGGRMERWPAAVFVLGPQWRTDGNVRAQPAAGGPDANLGVGRSWILVRPQPGISPNAAHAELALDASAWRHRILSWRGGARAIRGGTQNRSFLSEDKLMANPHALAGEVIDIRPLGCTTQEVRHSHAY